MEGMVTPATQAMAHGVSALVHTSFTELCADDWDTDAVRLLLEETSPDAMSVALQNPAFAAVEREDEVPIGVLLMPKPSYLSLLFVHPAHLRKGVARRLWEAARRHIEAMHPDTKTVELNSTPYALPAYRALGFVPLSAEFIRRGCRITRMACWLPARALGAEGSGLSHSPGARLLPDVLETARLRLRRPEARDAASIYAGYARDPEVCRFMIWRPHVSESVTRAFVASCIDEWAVGSRLPYVVSERGVDEAIGMLEARMLGTTVDLGYVLARSHWGRGLMPEALENLADIALRTPAIHRVQATCDTANVPSQRALEKAGFVREGRLARHTVHPNLSPEPRACFMYATTRP